jgi:hypothetical protein
VLGTIIVVQHKKLNTVQRNKPSRGPCSRFLTGSQHDRLVLAVVRSKLAASPVVPCRAGPPIDDRQSQARRHRQSGLQMPPKIGIAVTPASISKAARNDCPGFHRVSPE